jgi:putative glutamine amidotransferase
MRPRIAIPVPHSKKPDYSQRSLPQYVSAIERAGGEAVVIQLQQSSDAIARQITNCHGVLLPGSAADVDPEKYGEEKRPETKEADALRDQADELLLQDAFNLRKPVLGICYGLQSLNVWRTGTLVQDIHCELGSKVNHEAGRTIARAHAVEVDPQSRLAEILHAANSGRNESDLDPLRLQVNSSHHQSAKVPGDGLRIGARCPEDSVIEALEGTSPSQWVVAVQWHPERTYAEEPASRALFGALINAAKAKI